MEDGISGGLQHRPKNMLRERWPPWKVGLYCLEVVSLRERSFRTGGLAYDN